jgi:hypothetical protein
LQELKNGYLRVESVARDGNVYVKFEATVCIAQHSEQLADAYEHRVGLKPYTKKVGVNASEVTLIDICRN